MGIVFATLSAYCAADAEQAGVLAVSCRDNFNVKTHVSGAFEKQLCLICTKHARGRRSGSSREERRWWAGRQVECKRKGTWLERYTDKRCGCSMDKSTGTKLHGNEQASGGCSSNTCGETR